MELVLEQTQQGTSHEVSVFLTVAASSPCRVKIQDLMLNRQSNHTAEDDIEVFSTEDPALDWISAHIVLTRLQKLSSYASGHLEVSELAALSFTSAPSQTDTPKTDKNECTSLLKDLLSHLGYSVGKDDIINIDSLRKHSSLEAHTLSLLRSQNGTRD
ncbi:hypothetical protein Tco_0231432 [Tanacetum coccineum]